MSDSKDWRLDAYYYSFSRTGNDAIDRILSAVACAGKGYHHTDGWSEEAPQREHLRGATYVEQIQNAAIDAAADLTHAQSVLQKRTTAIEQTLSWLSSFSMPPTSTIAEKQEHMALLEDALSVPPAQEGRKEEA